MFFTFPSTSEWALAEKTWDFSRLYSALDHIKHIIQADGSIEALVISQQLEDWHMQLKARVIHTYHSYIILRFNYDRGIPDNEWYRSPGDDGSSVQYFPNFQEEHHWIKAQFEYYADTFYYKWFSAFDTIGQILNVVYNLGVLKPGFLNTVVALKAIDPVLNDALHLQIVGSDDFKMAKKLRHDITHNFLPGHVGNMFTVSKSQTGTLVSMDIGKYVTSSIIMTNVTYCLELLTQTMEIISEHCASVPIQLPSINELKPN